MDKILSLLDKNARMTHAQLASATGMTEEEVAQKIAEYEEKGVIRGYKALIDWDKTDREYVAARIELKILPRHKKGFEEIAEMIAKFDEVEAVNLMSGSYDLALTVSGKTFKEIALFVAYKLAPIDGVQSTSTSFMLRKYKEQGILSKVSRDEREVVL